MFLGFFKKMNSGIFFGIENVLKVKIMKMLFVLLVLVKDDVKVRLVFFFFRCIGYEGNFEEFC